MKKAALLVVVLSALVLPAAGSAGGSTTFADPAGDTPAADITTVGVSNDDTGLITFAIGIPNRPALTSGMVVLVFLDTDRNESTGSANNGGADYVIGYTGGDAILGKWNGSAFDFTVPQSSLTSSYASGVTLKVAAADIGSPTSFDFYVAADEHAADGTPQVDVAPDANAGMWAYSIQIAPPVTTPPPVTPKPAPAPKPKAKPKPKPKKKHH